MGLIETRVLIQPMNRSAYLIWMILLLLYVLNRSNWNTCFDPANESLSIADMDDIITAICTQWV